MSEPDYRLDIGGIEPESERDPAEGEGRSARPFISVHFTCCNAYARVYRNRAGTAYVGWCPKCARKVTASIGPDGTTSRLFTAG